MQFANGLVSPLFIADKPEEPTPGGTYSDVLAWVFITKEEAGSAFGTWVKEHLAPPRSPIDDRAIYDRSESINLLKGEKALILVSSSEGEAKGYFLCGTVLGGVSQGSWPSADLEGEKSKDKKGCRVYKVIPRRRKGGQGSEVKVCSGGDCPRRMPKRYFSCDAPTTACTQPSRLPARNILSFGNDLVKRRVCRD
jgi:hypothetical protein